MASRRRRLQRGPIPSIFQGLKNPNLPTAITGFWIDNSCGPNLDVSGCLHQPHFTSFKIHLLITNSALPQSPPSGGGQLLTPETQDWSPLLPPLQLSHPIHHQVLLSPPWKHPWNALTALHLRGHDLPKPLCPGQPLQPLCPSPWGHSGVPPVCSLGSGLRSS